VPFHVFGGLDLALLLNRKMRLRGLYRALLVIPWALPPIVAVLAWRSATRWRTRRAAFATPFPEAWRVLLRQWCDHYNRLPDELRSRFEDDVRILLAEKPITGVGVEVIDELRLLVAASADPVAWLAGLRLGAAQRGPAVPR
jgi:hypothetical protein